MGIKTRIAAVLTGTVLLLEGLVGVASADTSDDTDGVPSDGSTSLTVCYSSDSQTSSSFDEQIRAGVSVNYPRIYPGHCGDSVGNLEGEARVALSRLYGAYSYRIKPVNGSYGICHSTPSTGERYSNPPNVSKVYYKTYLNTGCATA